MSFKNFVNKISKLLNTLEGKISVESKFSKAETDEILRNSRNENIPYFAQLASINKLSAFDVTLILSRKNLSLDKIEIIKKAASLYSEVEFTAQGQTFSDFISRVCANLDLLDLNNVNYFKEIALLRSEIYDFSQILKNPMKNLAKPHKRQEFAFERVLVD